MWAPRLSNNCMGSLSTGLGLTVVATLKLRGLYTDYLHWVSEESASSTNASFPVTFYIFYIL